MSEKKSWNDRDRHTSVGHKANPRRAHSALAPSPVLPAAQQEDWASPPVLPGPIVPG